MRAYKSNHQLFGFQAGCIRLSITIRIRFQIDDPVDNCDLDVISIKVDQFRCNFDLLIEIRLKIIDKKVEIID